MTSSNASGRIELITSKMFDNQAATKLCVFWNTNNARWETDGVNSTFQNETSASCVAQRYASYTLLVLDAASVAELGSVVEETVTYIGYIGCGFCLLCLLITVSLHLRILCLELDKFILVWVNCCIAIILLNVFFIVLTRWQLCNTAGCTALMFLFHLFLLATFVWINMEIFGNYQLIDDFISYEQFFVLKRLLIGCGLPLAAVTVSILVDVLVYEPLDSYCRTPIQNSTMFYVMYLGYVCVATFCGLILFLIIFTSIVRQRRQQDPRMVNDHVMTLLVVHCLLGAAWVLGVLTARHGGRALNVAFCVVNSCLGLAILVRCMFDFRLRGLCADLPVDKEHEGRRRRRGSQDTWSHDSSPAAVGRTAASLTRDDSRDVFAGNSIITPAPQNGKGWRRLNRADADKIEASLKYGKPEVHYADALNNVRTDKRSETGIIESTDDSAQIGNDVATTDNTNNESLTYI